LARNHHYVPKCYLKGFIDPSPNPRFPDDDEPRVWQVEFKSHRIRQRPIRLVGCSPGFYELGSESEVVNEAAEQSHGHLETIVAPTLRRLNQGDFRLETEEWENLLFFAATLAMRVPNAKTALESTRQRGHQVILSMLGDIPLNQFIRQLEETYPGESFTPQRARELQHWAQENDDCRFPIPPHKWIGSSLKAAMEAIFPLFYQMNWTYLHTDEQHPFICSDDPVNWVDPSISRSSMRGHGLKSRNIEVSFPLGRSLALLGHWAAGPQHLPLTPELVDQINLRSIEQARIEIIGPTRESVERGLIIRA